MTFLTSAGSIFGVSGFESFILFSTFLAFPPMYVHVSMPCLLRFKNNGRTDSKLRIKRQQASGCHNARPPEEERTAVFTQSRRTFQGNYHNSNG